MEKAYDLKELLARLKARGLTVIETEAKIIIHETSKWISDSAALSANKLDDLASVALPTIEKFATDQADKIDGVVGN